MQHTDKYKLDLIEKEDAFSPDALNENTQKVEAALIAHEGAVKEVTDGLDQRVTVLEAKKFAAGTYQLKVTVDYTIELGFTPVAVLIQRVSDSTSVTLLTAVGSKGTSMLRITEGGFIVNALRGGVGHTGEYTYIAFG